MSAPAVAALIRASKPQLRTADDHIVFALHAWMLTRGYKLVALGPPALEHTGDARAAPEVDLHSFDDLHAGDYSLLYGDVEPQGAKPTTTLRCIKLTPTKLVISQLCDGATQTADIDVPDHVGADGSPQLPGLLQRFEQALTKAPEGGASAQPKEPASTRDSTTRTDNNTRPTLDDPLLVDRLRVPVGGVGSSDLYPAGINPLIDPMRGPGLPGGGMHVGPGDPLFGGYARGRGGVPGGPPGGRWDPIAPPGMPGFLPDDFVRGPRRPHPDVQPPGPGRGSDWDSMFG